jgi:hypothetical protein
MSVAVFVRSQGRSELPNRTAHYSGRPSSLEFSQNRQSMPLRPHFCFSDTAHYSRKIACLRGPVAAPKGLTTGIPRLLQIAILLSLAILSSSFSLKRSCAAPETLAPGLQGAGALQRKPTSRRAQSRGAIEGSVRIYPQNGGPLFALNVSRNRRCSQAPTTTSPGGVYNLGEAGG